MSINFKKFVPRPGLVNKQGRLCDPDELVCIEVPKIFDQCLIKRCLVFGEGPDTNTTDCELRSNPLTNPKRYIGSRDFNVKLISVEEIPLQDPGFKKIIISYMISFCADFIDSNGITRSELFEINRTDVIGRLYCPDPIAQISASFVPVNHPKDLDANIIKIEMVAEALEGELLKDANGNDVLDITLGYHLIVKCELIVQILIPCFEYCPVPDPCEEEPEEDPCERFDAAPVPKFYPDQNLEQLFPDSDDDGEAE